jgi:hypothetical protein
MGMAWMYYGPDSHTRWWSSLRTPNLEYLDFQMLHIATSNGKSIHIRDLYRTLCTSSEKLCYIRADNDFSEDGWVPGVAWHKLKEINLTDRPVEHRQFGDLIKLCTSLETVRIKIEYVRHNEPLVASSTLQVLDLTVREDPGAILDSLTLPALSSLLIEILSLVQEETTWPAIQRFAARHPDRCLEEFRYAWALGNWDLDQFATMAIHLPLFEELRHLELAASMSDKTMEALSFNTATSWQPLPQLEVIKLAQCRPTGGALSAMVRSRTEGVVGATLREVQVVLGSFFSRLSPEEFREDLGLQIPDVSLQVRMYPG